MSELVTYELADAIATVTLDDGKVNVMSRPMQAAIHTALDRAEGDDAVVVLLGRPGVFSAGFDLAVLQAGGPEATAMVRGGFELAARILAFPRPVIIGCTGHAVAMGAFLLLSGDYRIGVAGDYRLTANEVAIGLTMPHAAVAILGQRLSPSALSRAVTLAERFGPDNAVEAGFLDRVVATADLSDAVREVATAATTLDAAAHVATKRRLRAPALEAIWSGLDADEAALAALAS
jgi:enoyl-CoA hydratase